MVLANRDRDVTAKAAATDSAAAETRTLDIECLIYQMMEAVRHQRRAEQDTNHVLYSDGPDNNAINPSTVYSLLNARDWQVLCHLYQTASFDVVSLAQKLMRRRQVERAAGPINGIIPPQTAAVVVGEVVRRLVEERGNATDIAGPGGDGGDINPTLYA